MILKKLRGEVIALRKKDREQFLENTKRQKEREQDIYELLMERKELIRKTKNNEIQAKNLNQKVTGLDSELFGDVQILRQQINNNKPNPER